MGPKNGKIGTHNFQTSPGNYRLLRLGGPGGRPRVRGTSGTTDSQFKNIFLLGIFWCVSASAPQKSHNGIHGKFRKMKNKHHSRKRVDFPGDGSETPGELRGTSFWNLPGCLGVFGGGRGGGRVLGWVSCFMVCNIVLLLLSTKKWTTVQNGLRIDPPGADIWASVLQIRTPK